MDTLVFISDIKGNSVSSSNLYRDKHVISVLDSVCCVSYVGAFLEILGVKLALLWLYDLNVFFNLQ